MPAQPDLPPDHFAFFGIYRIIIGPQSTQRGQAQRRDAVHHLLVLWFSLLLSQFRGVLLEPRDEVLKCPRRNKHRGTLNRSTVGVWLETLHCHEVNTNLPVLERLQLEVDTFGAVELDVQTLLGTMYCHAEGVPALSRLQLRELERGLKCPRMRCAIRRPGERARFDLARMRLVRLVLRGGRDKKVLAIPSSCHDSLGRLVTVRRAPLAKRLD